MENNVIKHKFVDKCVFYRPELKKLIIFLITTTAQKFAIKFERKAQTTSKLCEMFTKSLYFLARKKFFEKCFKILVTSPICAEISLFLLFLPTFFSYNFFSLAFFIKIFS